ncbi:hypothetical protein NQ318_001377 [Aromia moschata]|uniref:Sodium-coupled monocarboxylate transporter 1 n=1 Tax=Aromia moschata TaxID=1265417 RepID=A0AAV8YVG2_9CUCU|nr:hypothetical protein NQ318_001377 [Aromia moschata]
MSESIPAMMSTLDIGEKTVIGLEVSDVSAAMQRFDWPDYAMFLTMLLICISVGVYYAFSRKSVNAQEYLVGGRNMRVVPVAFSLVASFISGISLLGIPTEVYVYGIQYAYIVGGFFLMSFAMGSIYLPIFHSLKLTSTYEYHERRFNKKVRLLESFLFTLEIVSWLPIVIYVPALAFNQVTGVNVHLITPIVCATCIFYTSTGGLKAVVWTDVIQIVIMFFALILVIVKGTVDVGGIGVVIQRNWDSGRIERPNALWAFFFGILLVVALCSYCGMIIYARFYRCDPLTTKLAREKDQLLPLLVMDILGNIPGMAGVFVAGIFSAALSSLSTGLNAMAAVVLEDFYKPFFRKQLSEKQIYYVMRLTVVFMGILCVGLVFIVEKLGAVLQLTLSMGAMVNGPSLGISTMGIFLPWVNSKGALVGGISSLMFMSWLCLRAQSLIASGDLTFPEKSVSTAGCHYLFTPKQSPSTNIHFDPSVNMTNITHTDETFMIYRLSYLWYTLVGTFITIFVGLLVSYITKFQDPRDVDPRLLAPFVRKFVKSRTVINGSVDKNSHENEFGKIQITISGRTEAPEKINLSVKNINETETEEDR